MRDIAPFMQSKITYKQGVTTALASIYFTYWVKGH